MPERDDHHTYSGVMLYRDTLSFFVQALSFYEDLLKSDVQAINDDPDLKLFLTPSDEEKLPVHEELFRIGRVREWLSGYVSDDGWVVHVPLSHGTVRLLKSVSDLYIAHLQAKRNALAVRPNLSKQALEAVDQKLASLRSKATIGVFAEATAKPLLVDQVAPASAQQPIRTSTPLLVSAAPRPVLLGSIEVLDPELRSRCLDLFGQFTETGQHDRLDTVVSEATRILEDRLRKLSRAADTIVGVELATFALGGSNPKVVLSSVSAEQEAAHLLFRGVFGFIRNRIHHHLVADLSPERTLQVVGTVDYLLFLLEGTRAGPA